MSEIDRAFIKAYVDDATPSLAAGSSFSRKTVRVPNLQARPATAANAAPTPVAPSLADQLAAGRTLRIDAAQVAVPAPKFVAATKLSMRVPAPHLQHLNAPLAALEKFQQPVAMQSTPTSNSTAPQTTFGSQPVRTTRPPQAAVPTWPGVYNVAGSAPPASNSMNVAPPRSGSNFSRETSSSGAHEPYSYAVKPPKSPHLTKPVEPPTPQRRSLPLEETLSVLEAGIALASDAVVIDELPPQRQAQFVDLPIGPADAEVPAELNLHVVVDDPVYPEEEVVSPAASIPVEQQVAEEIAPAKVETVAAAPAATEAPVEVKTPVAEKQSEEQPAVETAATTTVASDPPKVEAPAADTPFRPQWEVDRFGWPEVTRQLSTAAIGEIEQACEVIRAEAASGRQVLAITNSEEGAGGSTLASALARQLATTGTRVVLVDADFDKPSLCETLGVRVEEGWEAALKQNLPLEETCVASLEDGVVLLPLVSRPGITSTEAHLTAADHIRQLCQHFEVVLIDAGTGSANVAAVISSTEEAIATNVLVVRDARVQNRDSVQEVAQRLRLAGVESIQVAENFVAM